MKQHQNSRGFSHHFLLPVIAIVAVGAIGLVTLKLSGAATTCQGRLLKKGTSSVCVKYAAYMMNAVSGTGEKVKDIDTVFGQQMYDKTVRYQTKKKLGVDGKIGPKTWAKLCAATYTSGSNAAKAKAKACGTASASTSSGTKSTAKAKASESAASKTTQQTTDKFAAARKDCQNSGGTWDRNNYCTKKIDYCDWVKYKLVCRTATVSVGTEYDKLWRRNDDAWNACRSYMKNKHSKDTQAATIDRYCKERVTKP